jgi:DNA-binding response OmpR family regulator
MSRVLVVDDEPRIVAFVTRALSAEGLEADGAYDGLRALELAVAGRYELVVLDLLLPDLDGLSVLQGMLRRHPGQQVLVLSALTDVATKVQALELGATDYLAKPFAVKELVARVRARLRQLEQKPAEQNTTLRAVSLDVVRRTADSGAGPVLLSEREFLLLQMLIKVGGQVCSREQLLSEVWGYYFDPASNVVDVVIGRLRSKLGAEVIETVRNVGYRISTE